MTNCLLDIPDPIHRRLKMLAAVQGKKLKEVIIDALGNSVHIEDEGSWREMLEDIMNWCEKKKPAS